MVRHLGKLTEYRPCSAWWVITVQTFVLLLFLLYYGSGLVGLGLQTHSGQVLIKTLSLQQVWVFPNYSVNIFEYTLHTFGGVFSSCLWRQVRDFDE